MGRDTNISWCHHTFNPWEGCLKISPGCKHCYAEAMNSWLRAGDNWGPNGTRRFFSDAHWRKPLAWNEAAKKAGERRRVFCASIADVMEDRPELAVWRDRLWELILATPWLDWMILTKRPENFERFLPWHVAPAHARSLGMNDDVIAKVSEPYANVWLGVTAEDDPHAKLRIPYLQRARARVRFVSYEPALGAIDWDLHLPAGDPESRKWCEALDGLHDFSAMNGADHPTDECVQCGAVRSEVGHELHMVIFGDESGRNRRPAKLDWARSTRDACQEAGVAFHFKQWCGEIEEGVAGERTKGKIHLPILDEQQHAEFPT